MIKFFRQIRKQLLKENRISKYMLYAIGEIVLVVIGILIALQINNWNQDKKTRAYEVKMLGEVRNELIKDTIYLGMIKKRAESVNEAVDKLIKYSFKEEQDVDSIQMLLAGIFTGFQYIYHKGAYESIKSVGLDRISNDSIRLLMTDIYDFHFPRTQEFIKNNGEQNSREQSETIREFIDIEVMQTASGAFRPTFNLRDDKPFQNEDLMAYVIHRKSSSMNSIFRLNEIIGQCTKLIAVIDADLEIDPTLANNPTNPYEVGQLATINSPGVVYENGAIGEGLRIGYTDSKGYVDKVRAMNKHLIINYAEGNAWGVAYIAPRPTGRQKPYLDYSTYTALKIEMKGSSGGETVMIALKDNEDPDDGSEKKYSIDLTADWEYYEIPLDGNFANADLEKLFAVTMFVFGGKEGMTINVRNIRFE